jgi:hypothetical protein
MQYIVALNEVAFGGYRKFEVQENSIEPLSIKRWMLLRAANKTLSMNASR